MSHPTDKNQTSDSSVSGQVEIQYSVAQPEDCAEISSFLSRVFQKTISQELLMWKYFAAPVNVRTSIIVRFRGTCIGFHGIIPVPLLVDGKKILAGQVTDLALDPAYRRIDVFMTLLSTVGRETEKAGFALTFGFAGSEVGTMNSVFVDQQHLCRVPQLIRIVNHSAVFVSSSAHWLSFPITWAISVYQAFLGLVYKPDRSVQISAVTGFDDRFDRLWQKIVPEARISIVRDQEYLAWRYGYEAKREQTVLIAGDTNGQDIRGYAVLTVIPDCGFNRGLIMEFVVPAKEPRAISLALAYRSCQWLISRKADKIECWMLPSDPCRGTLLKLGFLPKSSARTLQHNFCILDHQSISPTSGIEDKRNWRLSLGDSDQDSVGTPETDDGN